MSYIVGVDIGGTCTDCVVLDDAGRTTLAKAFSTPPDFVRGVLDVLGIAADAVGVDRSELLARTRLFLHSTTIAENAIVDGNLSPAGLLVTRGFEETLYSTRGGYGRWSGVSDDERKNILDTDKPPTLVPLPLIRGIRERSDAAGEVLTGADEADVAAAVRALLGEGVHAIGICFLWSFRNDANEALAKRVVQDVAPRLFVTASSEVAPLEGEYERMSTVALNARLGPIVAEYLAELRGRLADAGFKGSLFIMQSTGGLMGVAEAPSHAVGMLESGPVGGVIASQAIGVQLGYRNVLATDMGGTTFKVGAIRDGRIEYERAPMVLRYHYCLPKIEMVSVGVAGGSIVSLEPRTRTPRIGPRSAGARPGPACYGFGGREPTVTDVDLILGYLNPAFFLGGRASLDRDRALEALRTRIAEPLGMDVLQAAAAVYRLTNSMIYDLLHRETVQKGVDPRHYTLFIYGGTGGMHIPAIGPDLGVPRMVVPYSASVHGAFGAITADIARTEIATLTLRAPASVDTVNRTFAELGERVTAQLVAEGVSREEVTLERAINVRYRRQVHVITTPVTTPGLLGERDLDALCSAFESLYAERYGAEAGYREAGIELVSFLVRGRAALQKPVFEPLPSVGSDPRAAFVETRRAYFVSGGFADASCYDFERLRPGHRVDGPAIVWTPITTLVVNPGQTAVCDRYKNLGLTW